MTILALLSVFGATVPTASTSPPDKPPVQIWMNNDRRFREGDHVRLQVDAAVDGYLLVLNYDTDGRLHILFPLDPRDDARVAAGRRYEVRDDNDPAAFRATGDGTGLIYSAIAREPWRFDDVMLGDHWDYNRISVDRNANDPEAGITDLVQQLSGPEGFDYDVAGYRVFGESSYGEVSYYPRSPVYIYNDYYYCRSWLWGYNRCPYDDGWSIGFGYGYYPYRYGYYPRGYGYYPYTPYYPGRPGYGGHRSIAVGRPRNYTVVTPHGSTGSGVRGGSFGGGSFGGSRGGDNRGGDNGGNRGATAGEGRGPTERVTAPPVNWRPRSVARPSSGDGNGREVTRGSGSQGATVYSPPARRARAEGPSYPAGRGSGDRGGDRGSSTPSRDEPRASAPPARSSGGENRGSGGGGGGGGGSSGGRASGSGGGGGGGGGGRSSPPPAPSRPRHP